MPLHFTKMHGAGNDFVVLDLRDGQSPPDPATCARIADRHRGVGCDQLLTVESPREAGSIASYRIWNADGSPSGQCGNGARCIAAWLVRDGAAPRQGGFAIDSPARTHRVEAGDDGGFTVEMGAPRFEPAEIPLAGFAHMQDDYVVQLANGERIEHLRFGAVSMGNPHAVSKSPMWTPPTSPASAPHCNGMRRSRRRRTSVSRRCCRPGTSACACTSAAWAKPWPAAVVPARRSRCWRRAAAWMAIAR
jgi:diaminopimelate epimerase